MDIAETEGLRFGPLSRNCIHLCIDMQLLFADDTPWHTPWMRRVLPNVVQIAQAHPADTIFTRFMTVARPQDGAGTWARYYERWRMLTTEHLPIESLELLPELRRLAPPAEVVDKTVYSPWLTPDLDARLAARRIDTVIVTGGETDICVLAAVLGAVDRGHRTILIGDALCSSSDEGHDATLTLFSDRFEQQIEIVSTASILAEWRFA